MRFVYLAWMVLTIFTFVWVAAIVILVMFYWRYMIGVPIALIVFAVWSEWADRGSVRGGTSTPPRRRF